MQGWEGGEAGRRGRGDPSSLGEGVGSTLGPGGFHQTGGTLQTGLPGGEGQPGGPDVPPFMGGGCTDATFPPTLYKGDYNHPGKKSWKPELLFTAAFSPSFPLPAPAPS